MPGDAAEVVDALTHDGILAGVPVSRLEPDRPELANLIVVACTETTTDADRAAFVAGLKEVLS